MDVVMIPAYQPDRTLALLTHQLYMEDIQVVVVDDGSGAAYREIFDLVSEFAIVLQHPGNRGKGAAIKTALRFIKQHLANVNVIGTMDADGQHLVSDMQALLAQAAGRPNTLVLGVRKVGPDMPFRSRFGNRITCGIFHLASGVRVSDTQTGLRAFDAHMLDQMLAIKGERYEYEMNVLLACARQGVSFLEVPVSTIYKDRQNSTSHFHVIRDSARIYKQLFLFVASSFSGFVLDYLLFSLLMIFLPHTAVPLLIANIAARLVSAFYNYSMNCKFVFHTGKRARTALSYGLLATVILLLNNLILEGFTQILGMSVYPAKLLTECLLFIFSFMVQNFVIFRKKKRCEARHAQRRKARSRRSGVWRQLGFLAVDFGIAAALLLGTWVMNYKLPRKETQVGIQTATASPGVTISSNESRTVTSGQEPDTGGTDTNQANANQNDTNKAGTNKTETNKTEWQIKFADKFTDTVVATDTTYTSPNLSITLTEKQYDTGKLDTSEFGKHIKYGTKVSYVLADIYVADISCIQTTFAQDTYGIGYTEKLTSMSARMKSVLAVNGDSYSNNRNQNNGTLIRNGVLYRNRPATAETCVLYRDGTMQIYEPGQLDGQKLIADGAYQSFIFGPSLLDKNGKANTDFVTWDYIRQSHPRTAIGYYEPGHYCLLLVDGRQTDSRGMFLDEMAKVFEDLGCKAAYNLDGGHCSFMTFGGQVANHPYKPEHEVMDGIFICEGTKKG